MQRTQLIRKFFSRVGAFGVLSTRYQAFTAANKPYLSGVSIPLAISARFHTEGHGGGDEATRTGQYLLNRDDVLTRVLEVVKNFEKVDASKVTPESHFVNDLGLNSLDVVEVVFAIEQEFILDIPDHDAEKIQSVSDAVEYISQNPMAK
ncbi:acyl carrier protein, mitochondrial precursor [Trypanosoma rangeli]|uniref:Acyl carrier protein n=1 Tax=Trypanosoma rangeli TaxID=5698 RepID=A0A422NXN1_TRYRA|nr:acyl carrier protein, mitochondrial precursor [Trypanosoma rangeli]RNF10164.1 acyl carrier protein, mitochondrial precursor [Trypanosoma rangeli]|eukprot:RNF10164.1 acyl carrier protein, mitochondrial precursor [Trypanosoma rangeli]